MYVCMYGLLYGWMENYFMDYPIKLLVTIVVLRRSKSMGDILGRVNDGTGEIIRWIRLVFVALSRVNGCFAPVDGWVPHASVIRVHVYLGPDATNETPTRAFEHLSPEFEVLLD